MQATSSVKWPGGIVKLKNRRQAQLEFGLNRYQIAVAVQRGQLRRVQSEHGGRVYYLADELEALARRISQGSVLNYEGAA